MPRVDITPENRAESVYNYPKLKLRRGEKARIIAVEDKPLMEFTHTLQAVVIMNGQPLKESTPDGGTRDKMEFLGRYICLGDPAVLSDKGRAPDTCPVCKAATETDAVQYPDRRFAAHIIQYTNLKPDSWELQQWGIAIKAWLFADKVFNTLINIKEDVGDIRTHDLYLGPCENENFQKFDIRPSTKQGMWLQRDEFKAAVSQLYTTGQTPYLEQLIGRKSRDQLEQDLQRVLLRHREAYGSATTAEDTSDAALAAEDLLSGATADTLPADADVSDLLGGGEEVVPTPAAEAAGAGPAEGAADSGATEADALLAGLQDETPDAVPPPGPDAALPTEEPKGETASFDDLLSQLPQ